MSETKMNFFEEMDKELETEKESKVEMKEEIKESGELMKEEKLQEENKVKEVEVKDDVKEVVDDSEINIIETDELGEVATDINDNFEQTVMEEKVSDETENLPTVAEKHSVAELKESNNSIAVATRKQNIRPIIEPQAKVDSSDIGAVSNELQEDDKLEEEKKQRNYNGIGRLEIMSRNKKIGWARIQSIEPISNNSDLRKHGVYFLISCVFDNANVSIPDTWFFEPTFNFGRKYEMVDDIEKAKIRFGFANKMMGAKICFLPVAMSKDDNGNPFAISSRVEAMKMIRDVYFFDGEDGRYKGLSTKVKEGTLASANVLQVLEKFILVECLGVETRIDYYNVNNEYVENCNDYFKVGDTLTVRVKKPYINDDKNVYLAVTGRLGIAPGAIKTMKVHGVYMGTVDHYTKFSDNYTIILKNGVEAKVNASHGVLSAVPLIDGDRVSVMVTRIFENNVVGVARKI